MELLIYRLIRVSVISVRYFCLIKDVLYNFLWFTKNIKCTFTVLIYSCLIHNSITRYSWQNFAKPLAKGLLSLMFDQICCAYFVSLMFDQICCVYFVLRKRTKIDKQLTNFYYNFEHLIHKLHFMA